MLILKNDISEARYWYGIQIDNSVSSPIPTSIGNTTLRNLLPIQNKIKACLLLENGTVNYYLNPTDWTKKLDGTASNLDGTDGDVMIEFPSYYIKFETSGTLNLIKISEYNLTGFTYVPKYYLGAYEASLNRSTLKLASVVNTSTTYRGGNNNSAWDALDKTLLGRPATAISRIDFRTYARICKLEYYYL